MTSMTIDSKIEMDNKMHEEFLEAAIEVAKSAAKITRYHILDIKRCYLRNAVSNTYLEQVDAVGWVLLWDIGLH